MLTQEQIESVKAQYPTIPWDTFTEDAVKQTALSLYDADIIGRASTAKETLKNRVIKFRDKHEAALVTVLQAQMAGKARKGKNLLTVKAGDKTATLTVNLVNTKKVKERVVDEYADFWEDVSADAADRLQGIDFDALGEALLFSASGKTKNLPLFKAIKIDDEHELQYSLGNAFAEEE